jgi:hypothetical protein
LEGVLKRLGGYKKRGFAYVSRGITDLIKISGSWKNRPMKTKHPKLQRSELNPVMNWKVLSCFLILLTGYCFATDTAPAPESEFKSIFDGKDLAGWQGDPVVWSVKNGAIHGKLTGDSGETLGSILVWSDGNVDDFELRFSCRFVDRSPGVAGNLNVKYRVADKPDGLGYWFVLDIHGDDNKDKGRLMEVKGRKLFSRLGKQTVARNGLGDRVDALDLPGADQTTQPPYRNDDWNEVAIIAEGNHLIHKLNGVVTADFIDENVSRRRASGLLALRVWLAQRGPTLEAEFKNLRLRRIQNAKIISAPPVTPQSKSLPASDKTSAAERLKKVKALYEQGLITKDDYDKKVKEIMNSF